MIYRLRIALALALMHISNAALNGAQRMLREPPGVRPAAD